MLVLLTIFFATTKEPTVSVSTTGDPEGLTAKLRSTLQGDRFWIAQYELSNSRIHDLRGHFKPLAEKDIAEIITKLESQYERLSSNGEMIQAEHVRSLLIDYWNAKRLSELKSIRHQIELRLAENRNEQ